MEIRAYKPGDEKKIMDLDARELPSVWNRRTLANWYWKYTEKNPAGPSLIWLAEHEERLIGHFAAVPYCLKVFDEEVIASHSIGALVEKKYQKRGLLKLVGDKLMEDLVKHNIPYTWGFPNNLAYEFEKVALGYEDLINFDEWELPKEKLIRKEPPLSFRKLTHFDDAFDQLWQECAPKYEIAIKRDKTYLNWRFIDRPDWWYFSYAHYEGEKVKGFIVLKLYREDDLLRGHIIDIFADKEDSETFTQLLAGAVNFFAEQSVDLVTLWIWGNPLLEKLLLEHGFICKQVDRPLIVRLNTEHKYKKQLADKSHWYFTMGDSTEIF